MYSRNCIRSLVFFLLFSLLAREGNSQQLLWNKLGYVKSVQNSAGIYPYDIKADNEGNLIIAGGYHSPATFDGIPLKSTSYSNAFLIKVSPSGSVLWIRTAPSGFIFKIQITEDNGILFAGKDYYNQPFDGFDPKKMPTSKTSLYIAKSDKNGNILWERKPFIKAPDVFNPYVAYLYWDKAENTYLRIHLYSNDTIKLKNYVLKPSIEVRDLNCKIDSNQNMVWARLDSSARNHSEPGAFTKNKKNKIYGSHYNDVNKNFLSIYQLDENGNQLRENILVNESKSSNNWIDFRNAYADDNGNLFLMGHLYGSLTINGQVYSNEGGVDDHLEFVCMFDSNLNFMWLISPLEKNDSIERNIFINISETFKGDAIYLSGIYEKKIHLGNKALNDSGSDHQLFISRINTLGQVEWLRGTSLYSYPGALPNFCIEDNCSNIFYGFSFGTLLKYNSLFYDLRNDNKISNEQFAITKFNFDSASIIQNKAYCKGIQLKCSNIAAFSTYKWYYQDSILGTGNEVYLNFKKTGHYPIRLEATNKDGCTAVHSDTFTYISPPHSAFYVNDSQGCQWVKYNFIDSSRADTIHKAIGERWDWDYGDGKTASYTKRQSISSHIYEKEGDYTVRLVYSNGFCSDTAIKTQKVHILPAPKPGFNIVEGTQGCSPFTIHIQDKSIGQVKKYTYSFGNGDSSHIASAVYVYNKAGNYTLRQQLLGTTGCITEDSALIQVKAGIDTTISPALLRAGFLPDGQINISWKTIPNVKQYHIYRSENNVGFIQIANSNSTQFTDVELSKVWQRDSSIQYKITATDSCGRQSAFSNIGRPALLKGENIENKYFLLHWTPYQQWEQGVKEYEISVQLKDGTFNPINIQNGLTYRDANLSDSAKEQCYQIRAIEYLGNGQESYSNILCLPYLPVIWIPDAFTPDGNGLNDIFRPSVLGIKTYKLRIYSRWGELLYQGNEAGKGWDGQYRGIPAPEGNYLYTLEAVGQNNDDIYRHGTLQLIR